METTMRHAVGKSTFKEGFAIPRSFEEWAGAPDKGCKREIRLIFEGHSIPAALRRIDNEQRSVQINYGNASGEPFRAWLVTTFAATIAGSPGGYIEVNRIGDDAFRVIPFPPECTSQPTLQIEEWLFHRGADRLFEEDMPLAEIPAVIHAIPFVDEEGQSFYNQAFARSFKSWDWRAECRVIPELGLKCDFAKDGVQVEVEFGNARTYYQDFTKFLLGNRYAGIELGVLVVPTIGFAKHLCDVGRQRAIVKGRTQYSGMIDFDKVHREFQFLEFMLSMPIAVAGIGGTGL